MIHVDMGSWAWHVIKKYNDALQNQLPADLWSETEYLVSLGAVFCGDHIRNIRRETYFWYKSNRIVQSPETITVVGQVRSWIEYCRKRFPSSYFEIEGLEADDLCAMYATERDQILTIDKDLLQLPGIQLITPDLLPWGIERQRRYTKLPIDQGERWLAYQLCTGDAIDSIPRSLFTRDRTTMKFIFAREHPLQFLIEGGFVGEDVAREHLNCLLVPTPLFNYSDPFQVCAERYGYG